MGSSNFTPNTSGKGEGGELTISQELWILLNEGKNIIESAPVESEGKIVNIVEDDGVIKYLYE